MSQLESTIDCRGLPDALTVLRIKQAILSKTKKDFRLDAVVDVNCDCSRITASLPGAIEGLSLLKSEADLPIEIARRKNGR